MLTRLEDLLREAALDGLLEPLGGRTTLARLVAMLEELPRTELLNVLKNELGVTVLPERQKLTNALAKAKREGRLAPADHGWLVEPAVSSAQASASAAAPPSPAAASPPKPDTSKPDAAPEKRDAALAADAPKTIAVEPVLDATPMPTGGLPKAPSLAAPDPLPTPTAACIDLASDEEEDSPWGNAAFDPANHAPPATPPAAPAADAPAPPPAAATARSPDDRAQLAAKATEELRSFGRISGMPTPAATAAPPAPAASSPPEAAAASSEGGAGADDSSTCVVCTPQPDARLAVFLHKIGLQHVTASLAALSLDEWVAELGRGRTTLLATLKEKGASKLPERQKIANELSKVPHARHVTVR